MDKLIIKLPPVNEISTDNPSDPLRYYYHPLVGWLYRKRINLGLSLINQPFDSLLEVGVGSGLLVPTLQNICNSYTGIDLIISSRLNDLAKDNHKLKFYDMDIEKTSFSDNSFDAIISFSVFEHIKNLEPAIKEVTRILKPGGQCIIGVPMVNPLMTFAFHCIGFHDTDRMHLQNVVKISNFLSTYLKVVEIKRIPSHFPPSVALYSCIKAVKII